MNRRELPPLTVATLAAGFAFLYLPILALVVYSFNDGRLVSVWSGFSLRWYRALLDNRLMLDSAWITLKAGIVSATIALLVGTVAALGVAFGAIGTLLALGLFARRRRNRGSQPA